MSAPSQPNPEAPRPDASPVPKLLRRMVAIYPLLLVLCGIGYAKYSSYQVDGDAVSFMDISDALRAHHFALAVNGYWNPGYAAALALVSALTHPSLWNELQTFFWVNFWIFLGCIVACLYLVRGMVRVRERFAAGEELANPPALSPNALALASLALLFFSFQRELNLGAVRADALLLFFFLLAGGILLRLQSTGRLLYYPLLGLVLGLAYLTKSFAFLPSAALLAGIFIFGLRRPAGARRAIVTGALLAGLTFAAIAGPYVVAISRQVGRPTTGESARLNYAFFIDQMDRWHEWHSGKMGHATAHFLHHERLLLDSPPVYSYDQHPIGSYPLWFDPSYWTNTIQPHVWPQGQLVRLARCAALLLRYALGHLEVPVLLGVLLLLGCRFGRARSTWLYLLPVSLWGLLMIGIYFPVDIQDRYMTGAWLLFFLPLLAMLRRPRGSSGHAAGAVAVLLAVLAVADATGDIADRRRMLSVTGHPRGAYSTEIYPAAHAIDDLGLPPGSAVACFGDRACYLDQYWARLAQTPIRAEIEVPDHSDPGVFWSSLADPSAVTAALRADHIAAIVSSFAPSAHVPAGWQQLGTSDYYIYPLHPAN